MLTNVYLQISSLYKFSYFFHVHRLATEMPEDQTPSAVADFYRNKNIFITGGTGFLGLAVIEKTLRSLDVCAALTSTLSNAHSHALPTLRRSTTSTC